LQDAKKHHRQRKQARTGDTDGKQPDSKQRCLDERHADNPERNRAAARTFPGNFLFSTGANEFAGRYTEGHFDIPMFACTIALDGEIVVKEGSLA